ncbi:TPA: phage tail protein [Enterobacter hormaechei subsp. xiangfangensis]|uniref:phage tail-collar fiber domain-containing protein n=1 Tax=Enterobacter hormaechei TaxID=158836 RepID=UPI001495DDF5|nr:phage tail protein [Enterobacter hormaechei]HAV1599541.1 phage tail protein [Enterobacter hormaechei subsp. xiangfangensis]ELD3433538.1 phage tail protein [Enterobacter hormaechei]EMB0573415.1 phage tail protein [Enterobacter hormaechei]EMB0587931.1 phage tail protein [Enterobacter hormaechei]EMB0988432.1 phage tail protein [Enterobacter hormaechei]
MTVKYKTVITKAGAIKLAAATVPNGKKVNFTAMAVGDGGGTLPVPDPNQTKLVKEVWRHELNKISQDRKNKNYVVAELLIPPETGGFWMRELGLYDDTGTLIAVGNMAESYKPALAEGSGRAQTVRMVIMVSDIESVELTIDTSTVMATQDYVDDKLAEHEQSRRHPDATLTAKGFTQLSSATDSASESVAATPKAVKAAYDLAKGKYTAQDATTAQKGVVQLSSATDSTSESVAATPKAVKAAYDLAKAKYTAQDATMAQKGIVQLSSATNSTSEALAATPKAVKAANDNANGRVPSGRRINGHTLTDDFDISVQDIFNGQAVAIGNAMDLNAYTTAGLYFQPMTAYAQSGRNYPEALAGSLEVYKHAGITQIYRIYHNSRSYIRTQYSGSWSAWVKQYDAANKPTAGDVGAIPLIGSTEVKGLIRNAAEFQSTSANSFRIAYGDYGSFWRNDGSNLYLMLTNKGDAYGAYNALRPLRVSLETGALQSETPLTVSNTIYATKEITAGYSGAFAWVEQYKTKAPFFNSYSTTGASEYHPVIKQQATIASKNSWAFSFGSLVAGDELSWHLHMKGSGGSEVNFKWDTKGNFTAPGQVNPGSYANFDNRYYTKAQSDAGYMAKTGAYTKAESDGRFQPKGNYTPAGQAYTKAESDARYGVGKTTTGNNSAYYTHGNGAVFMQSVRNISVGNNATVTVTLPTSFPNGILGIGSSYYGAGGNNSASFFNCTPVGKNQVKIETHNCNGTFFLNVTGY